MTTEPSRERATSSFEADEEQWSSERPRPHFQRPSRPAPSMAPRLDDSIADGWFYDVG